MIVWLDTPDITRDTSGDDPDGSDAPTGAEDGTNADDDAGGLVTRRRLLAGVAGGVGLLGGGGLYVARSLSGDFGGYDAPETQPMVTTRGRLDAADSTERVGSWDFDEADAVFLFVHGLGADAESPRDQAYTVRLGLAASASAPAGYADIDVTDLVADHYSYLQPEEGCLPRVVGRIGIE